MLRIFLAKGVRDFYREMPYSQIATLRFQNVNEACNYADDQDASPNNRNLPPWKITAWFPRVSFILTSIQGALEQLRDGIVTSPDKKLLPRLSTHWEELTNEDIKGCSFQGMKVLEGRIVVDQERREPQEVSGSKRRRKEIVF